MNRNNSQKVQSESPLGVFLNRLDGVERTSSGYKALCPAHRDTKPSLSLREENGKVLLHCHAGCSTEEVVGALGMEMSDLFADSFDASWEPSEGTEVATYTYEDEGGNPLIQVVRYEMRDHSHSAYGAKKFLQRAYKPGHEDAGKKGCPDGYVWGRHGTDPVLYRLPQVISAVNEGKTIHFVEGEKDVHTLGDRGLTATCNPGGATTGDDPGEKLTREMVEPLEAADVVIIPDNDEPGRQFAPAVARRIYPVAGRVRIVELPDVGEGGDVTDYLENGHSTDDLEKLVAETEPFEPPPETVDDLVERSREKEDPAFVFDHIDVLAKASEAEYHSAREALKAATGINLNGLESARQEAKDKLAKQRQEKRRERAWDQLDSDDLPVIELGDDRPSRDIVNETVEAYEQFNDPPKHFSRGDELVRVASNENGRPVFESVEEALFDASLARAATFVRETGNGISYHDLPMRLVRRVRQQVDPPPLNAIRELPFLRPDGTLVRNRGYDEETRIFFRPNSELEVPSIPEVPSRTQVAEAVRILLEPFKEFPFVDQASKANLLATVFTPIVRPLLDGANVPLVIFDATKQGTGKTLLADTVALVGAGRVPASMNAPSNNEEWRKQITSQLRKGEPIIVVDNVKGRLSSSALERVLTTHTWGDRLLGQSKQLRLPADALWIATGNNLRPRGEMTRRCILVRMDAERVRPWQRTDFEHPNLREWVRTNRGRLVAALLTAVRSWIEEGRPSPEVDVLGSFEKWAEVVGGVLEHIGIEGFLENLDALYETASSEENRWSQLLRAIHEWTLEDGEPRPFTAKDLSSDLKDHAEGRIGAESEELETIQDQLPEYLRERLRYGEPIARSLGKTLGYQEGTRFPGGWYVERSEKDRDGVHWVVRGAESGDDTRDNVTLDPSDPNGQHTPTPEKEEGGGSRGQGAADLNSQSHDVPDEAPF